MEKKFKIGFDIGGTNILSGLLDGENRIVARLSRPFKMLGTDGIVELLFSMAQELCALGGTELRLVSRIGICIPGSVDTKNGLVVDAHNLALHDSPFRSAAERMFLKPVSLLNDADAAALAEARLGALRGTKTSMLVTLGTGVGVGIILDGKLFNGGRGKGVEAGHIQMDKNGKRCTCGRRGCVETLCSASFLNARAREILGGDADAQALIENAKAGEPRCVEAWREYSENLASALASYINMFDPEAIALGGGVSGAGEFLIESIRAGVDEGSFFRERTKLTLAEMKNDAGLIGACLYE